MRAKGTAERALTHCRWSKHSAERKGVSFQLIKCKQRDRWADTYILHLSKLIQIQTSSNIQERKACQSLNGMSLPLVSKQHKQASWNASKPSRERQLWEQLSHSLGQLSDSLGQLSDSLGQLNDSLGQLSDSLGQLSSNLRSTARFGNSPAVVINSKKNSSCHDIDWCKSFK